MSSIQNQMNKVLSKYSCGHFFKMILLILVTITLTSCKGLIYKILAPKHPELKVLYNKKKDKTIAFIPMVHIAKPDFYQETKKIVDSLRKDNYIVFYESIDIPDINEANPEEDTLLRKFRRLIGFQIGDYTDEKNKSLPTFMKNDKYVMQTGKNTGVKKSDINLDLSAKQIIEAHEEKYPTITLNQCDWDTGFNEEYDCHEEELNDFYTINTVREKHIFDKTIQSSQKKILMIYGKQHYLFLYPDFLDKGYKLISDDS